MKKYIKEVVGTSLIGSAGSYALGSLGGTSAIHGQRAIGNVTAFLPFSGTIAGIKYLGKAVKGVKIKTK